jgi:hypothetical protein
MAIREELTLGIQNFQANLDRARADVRKTAGEMSRDMRNVGGGPGGGMFGGAMDSAKGTIAAAFSVGAIVAGVRAALDEAQQLSNLSMSLNESVESLGKVSFAAKALGMDFHTVAELGRELEDRLGDLGNAEPVEVMERFGFSIEELLAMPLEEKLLAIADAFEKSRGDGVAYSDLLKLLGDSVGEQLLPLLGQGKEALEAMFSEAPERSGEMINSMARMNEEIKKMIENSKEFGTRQVGSILGMGQFIKDFVTQPAGDGPSDIKSAFEAALLMEAEREMEFLQRQARNQEMAEAKAKAIADARAKEREGKAGTPEEKAEADQRKQMENFEAAEGEANRDAEGRRRAEAERRAREQESAEKQRQAQGDRVADLAFGMLDPEEQMKILRDRIESSLGVSGSREEIINTANAFAGAGWLDEAETGLQSLAQLEAIAGRQSGSDASGGGAQGSLATLMDEIFGRNPAADQLEESRRAAEAGEKTVTTLDQILKKMDEPPPTDTFTDNI